MKVPFESAFSDITREVEKIPKQEYLKEGKYPIIDQGDSKIAGYTNREDGVYRNGPVVLFGDHTRVFKYIDFPFFAGADGTKILKAKTGTDTRFGYYSFINHPLNSLGYSRHFKLLKDKPFYTHDYATQLRIAGVLGSLDEKIELNRKKIAELEALAKTIYDYWFVQFDFPDKNGKPYKSSGGKMVWNEQLKRKVPAGWVQWSIGKCGHFHRGVSYSKENEVNNGDDSISVYRGNNIARGFVVHDSNEVFIPRSMVSKSQILQRGQVLIAMSSGSKDHVGKAGLVTMSEPICAFGAFCNAFEPDNVYRCFVYDFFRSETYRSYIKQICSGTGINNLKVEHLETDLFAVPDGNEIMDRFNAIQQPLYDQMMRLDEECATLHNTRDDLLPLLMNGQVEVRGDK